jgi:hypothetical protein
VVLQELLIGGFAHSSSVLDATERKAREGDLFYDGQWCRSFGYLNFNEGGVHNSHLFYSFLEIRHLIK